MIVAVTGASGFLGPHLIARLQKDGHEVRTIGRRESGVVGVRHFPWNATAGQPPAESLEGAGAVYNLIGEPVTQRWNSDVKQRIRESRVTGTRNLVSAIGSLRQAPAVFVGGSAIGFYGDRADDRLTEASTPGKDFLARLCVDWEAASSGAEKLGCRVVLVRTGIVLGRDGGALKQIAPPFKAGVGGPIGSGKQWVSWIHLDDIIALLLFGLDRPDLRGAINATAPQPVRNSDFAHALGSALGRPSLVPVPVFALKLMFGEAASVLVASQRVIPEMASNAGFHFVYPDVQSALNHIYA